MIFYNIQECKKVVTSRAEVYKRLGWKYAIQVLKRIFFELVHILAVSKVFIYKHILSENDKKTSRFSKLLLRRPVTAVIIKLIGFVLDSNPNLLEQARMKKLCQFSTKGIQKGYFFSHKIYDRKSTPLMVIHKSLRGWNLKLSLPIKNSLGYTLPLIQHSLLERKLGGIVSISFWLNNYIHLQLLGTCQLLYQ